jgi:ubiquinone/menaquinone biosynthesis C-methylase UbiE
VSAQQQQQRTPEEYARFLEGAERVERMQVPRVIGALQLKPGMSVADIGAGGGLFSRPLARAVAPGGTTYAVDIDPELLKIIARTAREQNIGNIETVLATATDPRVPVPVDLLFICDALHHIGGQAAYIKGLRRYLKPGGRIAVIDFSEKWPEGHESMAFTLEQLDAWMKGAGLSRRASHDWLENSFFVIYG